MRWNGWTDESIEQLKKFIQPEVLAMGRWMRDYIAQHRAALDRAVFERYGAHLPLIANYFPAAFRGDRAQKLQSDSTFGRGAGSMSINPNFLIARKFHLKPPDTDADAFAIFMGNQLEQTHFTSWAEVMRDLKSVYGNHLVQKAIDNNFGRNVTENLIERIDTIAKGGGASDYAAKFLSKFYRYWIPARIAINASSAIKQVFSVSAYMNQMPLIDFYKNFATANKANPEYRNFVKWAKGTDYFKNRMTGGLDKDLIYLLNYTRNNAIYSPWADALISYGTMPTRLSDAWSALHGGWAVYKYHLDKAKKSGLSQTEAHDAAARRWMRSTDETQQSGYLKDQNYFQANQGAFRYLTAFLTNPIQVMNLQLQTMNELRYGKDKAAAMRKLGKQLLVNHLILPTLMQFTNDMLRHGFDFDDYEAEDYLIGWLLGQFESFFVIGKLLQSIGNYALDKAAGRRGFKPSIGALPLADDLLVDVDVINRIFTKEEISEADILGGVKAAGDFGMMIGAADSRAGAVGMALSALGSQGRRWLRLFESEKKSGGERPNRSGPR